MHHHVLMTLREMYFHDFELTLNRELEEFRYLQVVVGQQE